MKRGLQGQTREKIYAYVRERVLRGDPPTVRDVQHVFGFQSVQTARQHLEILVAENRLRKSPGTARGYRLPESVMSSRRSWRLPILGKVQAGQLSMAMEDFEGYISVDDGASQDDRFALRVRGESMTGIGIMPDDIVIVRKQPLANDGDIIVALVADEATIKRLRIRAGQWELHPENPVFAPIAPAPGTCAILGRVIEVRRIMK